MTAVGAVVACGFLISCGGGGASVPGPPSGVSLRFANTFAPLGGPGLAVDIYDDLAIAPSASAVPLIAGLPYGAISDYVIPRLDMKGGDVITLTALPAGSPPTDAADASYVFGWNVPEYAIQQATILLYNSQGGSGSDGGTLVALGAGLYREKFTSNDRTYGAGAPPFTGDGAFLADTCSIQGSLGLGSASAFFFLVDDVCAVEQYPMALTGALLPNLPICSVTQFPASAGTHQISVAWDSSTTSVCPAPPSEQATQSVRVGDGQQFWAWVYGSSLSALQLLTAPIAP